MKLTKLELSGLALFILFLVYLYYNPLKTQSIYYPVYKTQYVPVSKPRRYPLYPRPRPFPRPHPGHHHGHHPNQTKATYIPTMYRPLVEKK